MSDTPAAEVGSASAAHDNGNYNAGRFHPGHHNEGRMPPNHNRDANAWLRGPKKGGVWRRGRKKYKRGERSGTSGSKRRKEELTDEEKAVRAEKRAEEKKMRDKHVAWRCTFHKIMSAKTPHGDASNDVTFEERVQMIRELCTQITNVASAAIRVDPPTIERRGMMTPRTCELFLVLHAKRCMADVRKDFGTTTRIRLAVWEAAIPKEWPGREVGGDWSVVRDATPDSKQDAKLLVAALMGEQPKPSRKRAPPEEAAKPGIKLQRLSSGRMATSICVDSSMIRSCRSGIRRE